MEATRINTVAKHVAVCLAMFCATYWLISTPVTKWVMLRGVYALASMYRPRPLDIHGCFGCELCLRKAQQRGKIPVKIPVKIPGISHERPRVAPSPVRINGMPAEVMKHYSEQGERKKARCPNPDCGFVFRRSENATSAAWRCPRCSGVFTSHDAIEFSAPSQPRMRLFGDRGQPGATQ